MNKVGIFYAYWTREWDVDFVPFVPKVKDLGFDVLEVNAGTVAKMSADERDRLRGEAEARGIELTSCVGLPAEYDVASPDAGTRRRGIEFLKRQAENVRSIGATEAAGILYGSWPSRLPPGDDRQAWLDRSVESMREVAKTVEDCGAIFHMEVVNRFEQFLLNTAAEGAAYCERVGSDNVGLLLDTFHMNIEEDSFAGAFSAAGRWLTHVHIGETNRRAPGRGKMPWDEIFAALRACGYAGSIVMEPFLVPGGEVGRDISIYRDLQDGLDLDEEAARACTFVREKLAAAEAAAAQR